MASLVIDGGKKLTGKLTVHSAKNSAVAILCAATMIKGRTVLTEVPEIEEVYRILELLQSIGVKIKHDRPGVIQLDAHGRLNLKHINRRACELTRSSLFLLGALAAREKKFNLYKTGGCKLGKRTVRPHLLALEQLGVTVKSLANYYEVKNKSLRGAYIVMYESGDTATCNAVMAAVLAKGHTTIKMASANYMVQDLCYFLLRAGAKINGVGTTTLEIDGVKKLTAVKNYPIMPDPIVAMTYLAAGVVTHSKITVANCPLEFLELELRKLALAGLKFKLANRRRSKNGKFIVVDIVLSPSRLKALPDKIEGRPFPGLNIDNLPLFVPILLQAKGRTLVHDWAYENRLVYLLELQKLGAKVTLLDPHRLWVEGPARFRPASLMAPPALRPAVDVLLCMLAAPGRSVLRNTYEIDRGYENLYTVLNKAGAKIKLINN